MKCDVLIIGAGLAGSTCGFLLATAKQNVLAIDCADLVTKEKLCGGMLTSRSLDAMDRIFGLESRALYRETFTTMKAIDTRVRRGSQIAQLDAHMSIVRRKDLDDYALCRFLDAGGMVADRSTLYEIDPDAHVAYVQTPTGPLDIEYRILVVADGANSPTRKLLSRHDANLKPKPDIALVPSIEALVEPTGGDATGWYVPSMGGYCWYFPCGERANIGAGGTKASASQLRNALDEFMGMMGISERGELRGAFIPSGGSCLVQSRDAFFLGDAAGLACPATGEGIFYALQSAETLASCLVNGVSYERAMTPHLRTLRMQFALSKPLLNDNVTRVGLLIAEALRIDPARIPRAALKFAASY